MTYNPFGRLFADLFEADYLFQSIYQDLKEIAQQTEEKVTVSVREGFQFQLKRDYFMLSDEEREKVAISTYDSDYLILYSPYTLEYTGESVIEGYIKAFENSAYGIRFSPVYRKNEDFIAP